MTPWLRVGASAYDRGYVGHLLEELRRERDPTFRMVNLSVSGAGVDDVLAGHQAIVTEAQAAGLLVADVWARTGRPWARKFAADHFHPNDAGHADWAAAFASAVGLSLGEQ